jgi:dTDP-4-amino-4,6-dideoxygalactose transaminase
MIRARPPHLPVIERAADQILSLPMSPHLTERDVERVAHALGHALAVPEPAGRPAS